MFATFINSFILFFVTIDAIGNLPFFLSLTEDAKIKKRNEIALKSTIIAFFIMIVFAYVGRYLLDAIGVSLDSLKIAGGIILMFLAIDILFEKRKVRREKRVEEALDERTFDCWLSSNGWSKPYCKICSQANFTCYFKSNGFYISCPSNTVYN